ncbi:nonribosomal peptide synthetase dtxS1 [Colletotrichum liriopes]|uniref:Nonribosomal peptide synthetase dtxS1 n=1 Tax=Colletotrichum liriopes TaxID=708192 RepID=A0AA37GYX9_9PEZI|nr:nonribosomal peptide synthetase dtxS1 [Colletotrichum liriopes]
MANDTEACSEYWKKELHEITRATFSPESKAGPGSASRTFRHRVAMPSSTGTTITKPTILRAAWAIVLACYCALKDVCFGATISGRNAPVPGIEKMAGPAIATIPLRVQVDKERATIASFLVDLQDKSMEMVPFEQFGLQNIARLSPEAQEACAFTSLLVVPPVADLLYADNPTKPIIEHAEADELTAHTMDGYFNYPLVVQGHVHSDKVELALVYDPDVLSSAHAGAAWSALDPGHPSERHGQIVRQTGSRLTPVPPTSSALCAGLTADVVVVSAALDRTLGASLALYIPETGVGPDSAAYVLFMSGSTGVPKGFVMEHESVCTS